MGMKKVLESSEFQQLREKEEQFLLLKNSTTCPISHEAYKETEKYASENPDLPIYYLNVQESKALSNELAETFKVKHESPQVLLFKNGEVVWNASHWKVTKKSLANAWSEV